MTARERFIKIARFQLPNTLFISGYNHSAWHKAIVRWVEEGAPREILTSNVARFKYFSFDRISMVEVEASLLSTAPTGGPPFLAPVRPRLPPRMLEEDNRSRVIINEAGVKIRQFKDDPQRMPLWLEAPVKNRKDWEEYQKLLDPHHPERWLAKDWGAYAQRLNQRDYPVGLDVGSFYGLLREWTGSAELLYLLYDDPQLVHDMMAHMEYFSLEIVRRVLKDIQPDFAVFFEDMAWKGGSFISPKMFREFMMPHYKKVTSLLRSKGVDIIFVDSDGDVSELIPLWIESGVNGIYPLEVAAGMDAVALRKRYGKQCILWGNIDKRALAEGQEAIKEELDKKIPFLLSQGGYFPGIDHFIPEDVSLQNFQFYLDYLRSLSRG